MKPEDKLRAAVEAVAATDAGKELLTHFCVICGYAENDLYMSPKTGEIDPMATVANAAMRRPYLRLRHFIPVEIRRKIEIPDVPATNSGTGQETKTTEENK
jgi:hypothetical protein